MAIIVMQRPGHPEETITLPPGEAVIGRLAECTIAVDHQVVSRRHAALSLGPGGEGYQLRDLGSSNGTWVNGKRIGGGEVALHSGDRIQLGKGGVVMHYFADEATVPEGRAIGLGFAYMGQALDLINVGGRWNRLLRAAPWLRLVATVLGIVAALLGITFWVIRLLAG